MTKGGGEEGRAIGKCTLCRRGRQMSRGGQEGFRGREEISREGEVGEKA